MAETFYTRGFPSELEFDLKSGLLADVLMSAPTIEQHDHLQGASRIDSFLAQRQESQSPSPHFASEMWVPSCEEYDAPTSADSHATAPSSALFPVPMCSPGYQPFKVSTVYDNTPRGPIAAPYSAFPSVDADLFKRAKLTETESCTSPLPEDEQQQLQLLQHHQQLQQQQQQQQIQAPLTPPAHTMDMSSPSASARAVRAASRGKRSPTSDQEDMVPYSPTNRTAAGPETRRRRAERQLSRGSAEAQLSEEERLEKNRQSARDCRLRKKRYIESLERRLADSERRESVLTATIARLEAQIAALVDQP